MFQKLTNESDNINEKENKKSVNKQDQNQKDESIQKSQKDCLKINSRETKKFQSQIQNINSSNSNFMNTYNYEKKDDSIMNKFFQFLTGIPKKSPTIKITPLYLIHKIQQTKPNHQDNLVNKQILFDVLLEKKQQQKLESIQSTEIEESQGFQINNCVASIRTNSEIYKRISKKFFENFKNGVDQCLLFLGSQNYSRISTSIGSTNNPGMLMIVAIAILDEKYKDSNQKFDIQLSFLQYRNQKMYDLLNYTQTPLKIKQKDNSGKSAKVVEFGQHRVKISTFLQFIKHFKIALFNNKQRDFKDPNKNKNEGNSLKIDQNGSTFIMKIRIKRYNNESELIFQNETTLIDFDEKSSNKINLKKSNRNLTQLSQFSESDKFVNLSNTQNSRSLLDYLLIEINNSNPFNKPIHYHMVQKNLLLAMLKKYFRKKEHQVNVSHNLMNVHSFLQYKKDEQSLQYTGGQIFLINCMTNCCEYYDRNIQTVKYITQCVGSQWQAYVYTRYRFNRNFDLQHAERILQKLVNYIKIKKYELYKDFQQTKQYYIEQGKKIINWISGYKSVILQYSKNKKDYKYFQNLMIAYQLQLIGNCIKSDNFKEFYMSKIYLALPRQLQIKTQNVKQEIKKCVCEIEKVQEKFISFRKKQSQARKVQKNLPNFLLTDLETTFNSNSTQNMSKVLFQNIQCKFKDLKNLNEAKFDQFKGLQEFLNLRKYILQIFHEIWYKINLTEERTITEQIIFEENFSEQTQNLKSKFNQFIVNVQKMDETNIKCGNDERKIDTTSVTHLLRSLNKSTMKIFNIDKDQNKNSPFKFKTLKVSKKENIDLKTGYLPKITEVGSCKMKTLSIGQRQRSTNEVLRIKGKVNFQDFIVIPKKKI